MGKDKSSSPIKKHMLKIIFLISFLVLMLIIFIAALLFHLYGIPVQYTLLLVLPVIFLHAYFSARHTMVLGTVVSSAILGALFVGVGFQLLIKFHVYIFWFQTIQVLHYAGIAVVAGGVASMLAVFAAQLSFRHQYLIMERKRRKKHRNKYGEDMPHPDFIRTKSSGTINSSKPG